MQSFVQRHSIALLISLFGILYTVVGMYVLDPDFGWEVVLGRHILQQSLPAHDIFSYTMPSYPFIDHEWVTHAAIAFLLQHTGMIGLSTLFAAIAASAVYVATSNAPKEWRQIIIILLGLLILNTVGVRPQIITFLFFSVVTQLALSSSLWKRWRWYMPLMFFFWANLHGGFVIGLATIGLVALLKSWDSKKILWRDIAVVIASAFVTLINPYGIRLWQEVLLSVFDTRLRYTVNEWMPTILTLEPTIWFFIAVTITYLLAKHQSINKNVKILFVLFLFLGLTSYRNIALFAIFAAAASTSGYLALQQTVFKSAADRQRFYRFHSVFFRFVFIGMVVYLSTLFLLTIKKNTVQDNYPVRAISYLKSQPPQGNILSLYEWGGYLLWKYPDKKVFVDGRMPSWRQNISNKPTESADATADYLSMFRLNKPFAPFIKQYGITAILIKTTMVTINENATNREKESVYKLLEQMRLNHMTIVYNDPVATLFVRQ